MLVKVIVTIEVGRYDEDSGEDLDDPTPGTDDYTKTQNAVKTGVMRALHNAELNGFSHPMSGQMTMEMMEIMVAGN